MAANILAEALNHAQSFFRSLRPVRLKYPRFGDLQKFCDALVAAESRAAPTSTVDLGCGTKPRNPFRADTVAGLDIRENEALGVRCADLAVEPLPWPDASFDYVTAFDFIEHVPRVAYVPARRFPFVELMNEVHRVLKPGGVFLSSTPAYPFAPVFRDPTHVNVITEDTFPYYFDAKRCEARMYGFRGAFDVVRQGWRRYHLITVLKRVEPRAAGG